MDQDNKNTTGAPSNDTTSALFVSARKKQLEQQEADRRAKEKEEQRLAAEAEVRRLEREVEERRRKAEEDAKRAEEDARRIAEEARARQAQAASNPDAILGAQPEKKETKLPSMPKLPKKIVPVATEKAAKAPLNTKMLAIIGGGVAVVILIVVLVMTMGGGGDTSQEDEYGYGGYSEELADGSGYSFSSEYLSFHYPDGWYVTEFGDVGRFVGTVVVSPSEEFTEEDIGAVPFLVIADFTDAWNESGDEALENVLTDFTDGIIKALSLGDILGESDNVEYLGEESLTDVSGVGYGVTLTMGDTVCLSQLAFTDDGRAYGSIAVGIADEYNADIDAILTTITE